MHYREKERERDTITLVWKFLLVLLPELFYLFYFDFLVNPAHDYQLAIIIGRLDAEREIFEAVDKSESLSLTFYEQQR